MLDGSSTDSGSYVRHCDSHYCYWNKDLYSTLGYLTVRLHRDSKFCGAGFIDKKAHYNSEQIAKFNIAVGNTTYDIDGLGVPRVTGLEFAVSGGFKTGTDKDDKLISTIIHVIGNMKTYGNRGGQLVK